MGTMVFKRMMGTIVELEPEVDLMIRIDTLNAEA